MTPPQLGSATRFCGACGQVYPACFNRCTHCGANVSPCPLVFRSDACGYAGNDAGPCQKTVVACRDRFGNFTRFAGGIEVNRG